MNTNKKNKLPFFARLSGATANYLMECTEACASAFSYIGKTILFTAILSGTLVAYTISTLAFNNIYYFPIVFLIWVPFIYLFDRLVVFAKGKKVMLIRVAAILVFAVFHSLLFDTLTLSKDIETKLIENYNQDTKKIKDAYDKKTTKLNSKIDSLQKINQSLNASSRGYLDSLQAEGRNLGGSHKYGIGKVYNKLEGLKDEYKKYADNDKRENDSMMFLTKVKIDTLNNQQKAEISLVVKPKDVGLLKRIEIMHQIVFEEGNITTTTFFILYFLLFCFLESLPVLAKVCFAGRLKDYFRLENADIELNKLSINWKKSNRKNIIETKLKFELQIRLTEITENYYMEMFEKDQNKIFNRLEILRKFLQKIEDIEKELTTLYPKYSHEIIHPEINRAKDDFLKSFRTNS